MADNPIPSRTHSDIGIAVVARIALGAALLVPLGIWLGRWLDPQPHLQWSVTQFEIGRTGDEYLRHDMPRSHLSVELVNTGNAPTDEVRVRFSDDSEEVVLRAAPDRDDITTEGLGSLVELGHIPADEVAVITIFGGVFGAITVTEGEHQVEQIARREGSFAEPRAWLPDWMIHAGALMIMGLLLEVIRLRSLPGRADRT